MDTLDIIERSRNGPKVEEKDWDFMVWRKGEELAKSYKINADLEGILRDDVADDIFEASIQMICDLGIYNQTSRRMIKFTEQEVKDKIANIHSEIPIGEGKDQRTFSYRRVESNDPILLSAGHMRCSEEIAPKLYEAMARLPRTDWLEGFIITSISGLPLKGLPYEVLATIFEVKTMRESITRANRPGMSLGYYGIMNKAADYIAALNPNYGIRPVDSIRLSHLPELKITDEDLASVIASNQYGTSISGGGHCILGGFAGGQVSSAITSVASAIGEYLCFNVNHAWAPTAIGIDVEKKLWYSPETFWCTGIAYLAHSRNIKMPSAALAISSHEPNTKNRWLELAVTTVTSIVLGYHVHVFRPSKPMRDNLQTPLELQFCMEIADTTLNNNYKKDDMLEFLRKLAPEYMPVYEKDQSERYEFLKGNPFEDLYDLESLLPKQFYLEQYSNAKKELRNIGFLMEL